MIKNQKKITFINNCNVVVDYSELEKAVLWYAAHPVQSEKHIYMHGEYPAVSKGKRAKYKSEVTPETVFALKSQGLSFNKISKILNLDWGCVKQRYEDYVHDNPELLK